MIFDRFLFKALELDINVHTAHTEYLPRVPIGCRNCKYFQLYPFDWCRKIHSIIIIKLSTCIYYEHFLIREGLYVVK